jgi:hypothetical protein
MCNHAIDPYSYLNLQSLNYSYRTGDGHDGLGTSQLCTTSGPRHQLTAMCDFNST